MDNKIKINQENYEKILEIANKSSSVTDLCRNIGYEKNWARKKQLMLIIKFE